VVVVVVRIRYLTLGLQACYRRRRDSQVLVLALVLVLGRRLALSQDWASSDTRYPTHSEPPRPFEP
jgi:hypothetical protein